MEQATKIVLWGRTLSSLYTFNPVSLFFVPLLSLCRLLVCICVTYAIATYVTGRFPIFANTLLSCRILKISGRFSHSAFKNVPMVDASSSMCGNDENLDFYQKAKEEDPAKPKRFRYTSKDLIAKTCISRSTDFEASPPIVHFAGPILLWIFPL